MLMRHGKSDWGRPLPDQHRPLKKRGRRAARAVGRWLRKEKVVPDLLLSSPARRALDTARLVAAELELGPEMVRVEEAIYGGWPDELMGVIRAVEDRVRTLLLVGHNPDLEDLVLELAAPGPVAGPGEKILPTAALAVFSLDAGWAGLDPDRIRLVTMVRPRQLAG